MLTIFRREFATYFNSPIGYIYVIVFLLLNASLFMTPFFMNPQADMRPMFNVLPFILCVLIPLITMRLWAEDRKENTIEMLLTFPISPSQLVLGKYMASFTFFLLTVAGTVTIPFMLWKVGNPDWGVILTCYLGTFLLGAFFLALGIFLSGLVKDQIIAAVMALASCFLIYLAGTDFVAMPLDGWWNGLGTFIKKVIGLAPHYESFCRGIISLSDLLYFLIWSTLFLFLNGFFLEGRSRPGAKLIFSTTFIVAIIGGTMFNFLISDTSFVRLDCTEGKIYTVSEASKGILKRLKVPVTINVYITPSEQMPTDWKGLEEDIVAKLSEMSMASNNKLKYKVVHLEVENLIKEAESLQMKEKEKENSKDKQKEAIEVSLAEKGVKPFSLYISKMTKQTSQLVYSAIGISYEANKEEIIPQFWPQMLYDLEYQVISRIYHLIRAKKPSVVLVAPKDEVPPHIEQILRQMGRPVPQAQDPYKPLEMILQKEEYDVKRVSISKRESLPDNYDAMIILNPKEFNERQKWEIARALYSGKNVLLAVQDYNINYEVVKKNLNINKISETHDLNDLLKKYGLTVDSNYLMDENNMMVTISSNTAEALFGGGHQIQLPMHVKVSSKGMNHDISITSKLSELPYLFGTALNIDDRMLEKNKLKTTILMKSTEKSWKVGGNAQIIPEDIEAPLNTEWMRIFTVDPMFVFNADVKYQEELDKAKISDDLKTTFKDAGITLSGNASVETQTNGANKIWVIKDEAKYYVMKDESNLVVYHEKFQQEFEKGGKKLSPNALFITEIKDRKWTLSNLEIVFTLDARLAEDMDSAKLTENVIKAFADKSEILSTSSTVDVREKGTRWALTDKDYKKRYVVEKSTVGLEVFLYKEYQIVKKEQAMRKTQMTHVYEKTNNAPYPLMIMLEGQFPDVYQGRVRPSWPKSANKGAFGDPDDTDDASKEPQAHAVTPAPAKMIVMGCSTIFRKEFVQNSIVLFINCVESLALSGELISIRSRKLVNREIENMENRLLWQIFNYAFFPCLFFVLGIIRLLIRKFSRDMYTMRMQKL